MVPRCVEALDDGEAVAGYLGDVVADQRTAAGEAAGLFVSEVSDAHCQLPGHPPVLPEHSETIDDKDITKHWTGHVALSFDTSLTSRWGPCLLLKDSYK